MPGGGALIKSSSAVEKLVKDVAEEMKYHSKVRAITEGRGRLDERKSA